jgi:hypothetical protein
VTRTPLAGSHVAPLPLVRHLRRLLLAEARHALQLDYKTRQVRSFRSTLPNLKKAIPLGGLDRAV